LLGEAFCLSKPIPSSSYTISAKLTAAPFDSSGNNAYSPRADSGGLDLIDLNDLIFNPSARDDSSINSYLSRAMMDLVSCLDLSPGEAGAFLTENPDLLSIYSSNPNNKRGDLLSQLMYFQNEMCISRSRLTKMIIQHPKLVASTFLDHEHDIKSTMDILRDALNYTSTSEEWYDDISVKLRKHVYAMKYHRSDLRRMLNLYTNAFGLSTMELRRLILLHPRILETSPQTLVGKLDILQKELGFSVADCKRLATQYTTVLCCCLEKNSLPKVVNFFKSHITTVITTLQKLEGGKITRTIASVEGMPAIKHILVECPHVLVLPIETRLAPTIYFLRNDVLDETSLKQGAVTKKKETEVQKQTTEKLRKIVEKVPEVLSYSVESNLRPKLHYLSTTLSLNKEEVRKLVLKKPEILTLSLGSNLKPKLEFFLQNLNFSPQELKRVCLANPSVLHISLENNLRGKVQRWVHDMRLDPDELKEFFLGHPQQLTTHELDPRMRRRIRSLKSFNGHGVSLVQVPLSILSGSEYIFQKWISTHLIEKSFEE